ncbi:MAG: hypothetical protein EBU90_06800 [Proteobacteria bacterium]|jgi:hypothetical protein|nr:hypothetical protein [Pseudomonadota bacterium]NBP14044.1 hypothetical protein [bacterium]
MCFNFDKLGNNANFQKVQDENNVLRNENTNLRALKTNLPDTAPTSIGGDQNGATQQGIDSSNTYTSSAKSFGKSPFRFNVYDQQVSGAQSGVNTLG